MCGGVRRWWGLGVDTLERTLHWKHDAQPTVLLLLRRRSSCGEKKAWVFSPLSGKSRPASFHVSWTTLKISSRTIGIEEKMISSSGWSRKSQCS